MVNTVSKPFEHDDKQTCLQGLTPGLSHQQWNLPSHIITALKKPTLTGV